jgi:2-oxoglutarate dehydrogenase E1 component
MSPKSMLRLRAASSSVDDFTAGTFMPVLGDPDQLDPAGVTRVVLTAGKVFYDLLAARRKSGDTATALVRLEQLYPLPGAEVAAALAPYTNAPDIVWAQEEPANQGAWSHVALSLREHLPSSATLRRVSRKAAASPAAGSSKVHEAEQAALIEGVYSR